MITEDIVHQTTNYIEITITYFETVDFTDCSTFLTFTSDSLW